MSGGKQGGATLLMVMSLLSLLAMLVLSSSQLILNARLQIANAQERRRAEGLARQALSGAERWVLQWDGLNDMESLAAEPAKLYGPGAPFAPDCHGTHGKGLCEPTAPPEKQSQGGVPLLHPCGNSREYELEPGLPQWHCPQGVRAGRLTWSNPRYVVELIDPRFGAGSGDPARLYRITVRAWGHSRHSAATMQSWYRVGAAGAGRRLGWEEKTP
ncbi:pilus assembly protein [Chromobacterium alticapitis]|nr:pilus assembly protein [Chromobacterium alticapitis]